MSESISFHLDEHIASAIAKGLRQRGITATTAADTEVVNGARAMRTVIVVDEAHHYLRDRKRSRVLQRLIREIRSKGASVFLLSQSPDDYETDEFNFAELLEFVFILQSSASANKFLQSALGITAQRAHALVAEVGNLTSGQGITKSFEEGKRDLMSRLNLRQFWRDHVDS